MGKNMTDILQYRQVKKLEYTLGQGEMKINMEGTLDNYFSNIDEIEINPSKLDMEHIEINENIISMKFTEPIICNVNSGRYHSVMTCGTKFEGDDENSLVERLEGLADKISMFQDDSLKKMKDNIQSETKEE